MSRIPPEQLRLNTNNQYIYLVTHEGVPVAMPSSLVPFIATNQSHAMQFANALANVNNGHSYAVLKIPVPSKAEVEAAIEYMKNKK